MISLTTLPDSLPSKGTAVSLGLFDGLHRGHFAVLNNMNANANGLDTIVFTFSTDTARPGAKTNLRLLSRASRDAILRGLSVDYIVEPVFESIRDMPPQEFVQDFLIGRLKAKKVFCGEDFRFGKNAAADTAALGLMLEGYAGLFVSPVLREDGEAVSTTRIRELIQNGDVERASLLLGRFFEIDFEVAHGSKLARTWGMPTINQPFPENFVVPRFGVYASSALIGGKEHISVTNVGVKPTVGSRHVLAETYIHDFTDNAYGKRIPVRFIKFIRDEKKFDSVEALKAQIVNDNTLAEELVRAVRKEG